MSELLNWIWLSTISHPGTNVYDRLFEYFDTPEDILNADASDFDNIDIKPEIKEAVLRRDFTEAREIHSYCVRNNIGLLPIDSDFYPRRLKSIYCKPILLYYRGSLPDIDESVCIAMVGTRNCTEYGKRNAYTISFDIARAGAIVVSGLALGIDTQSHQGAIDSGGKTIAVLGSGIDVIYPKENTELFNNIMKHNGTIFTEYKPGASPIGSHFPVRNRIISGLSQGVAVIEADLKSGAMITARTAILQGRDIFALPGEVGESNSRGTLLLIKDGAKPLLSPETILKEYEYFYPGQIHTERINSYFTRHGTGFSKVAQPNTFGKVSDLKDVKYKKKDVLDNNERDPAVLRQKSGGDAKFIGKSKSNNDETSNDEDSILTGMEKKVLDKLSYSEQRTVDSIIDKTISISDALACLTMLEIKGFVSAFPGGLFKKIIK